MTDFSPTAPEIKATAPDIAGAFEDFSRTFEAFKDVNDQRLGEIEQRLSADPLTEEKLTRIDAALDTAQRRIDGLVLKSARPKLGETSSRDSVHQEHKAAFGGYLRDGVADGLKRIEAKAYSAGVGPDGGFLVPQSAERDLLSRMALISQIRQIAEVREISTATFKKVFATNGIGSGWIGEAAARPDTTTQTLADLTFPTFELYAQPSATQTVLDDAAVDVEEWIAREVETIFAEVEGDAFINGDGTTRPQGFLTPNKVANASWTWGNIGYLATGIAAGFAATNPSDGLVDLIYALKSGYRQNASFVMNRRTQSQVRKFKDTTGTYLWQPPASVGQPATLMNFPVIDAEQMPDIAANSFAIAFGDFRRGYLVLDRQGIRVLRDPFTSKPYVRFYTTKRVGGGVQDFDAIKLMKFGVS
jgi:HK97 family phage major capsid protein